MPLPTHTSGAPETKARFGERYVSEAVNRKFIGFPFGVYLGFAPAASAGSLILRLEPNSTYGVSFARTQSTVDQLPVDIVTTSAIELEFDGHDFVADPTVYVMARAAVVIGGAATGDVFTRPTGPADLTEQLLCVVSKPSDDLVIADDAPANRDTPYAYTGAPIGHGFMSSGAVEEIQQAVAMVAEVIAARTDLDSVYHYWNPPADEGLHDRIVADLQPAAIAGRLGLVYRTVRSNNHAPTTDTSEINVSGSFTETARLSLPVVTFDGQGSETQIGAVTADDAEDRNICFVVEDGTNARLVDGARRVGFGRIELEEKALTGTLTFSAVSPTVTGAGTDFTDPTQTQVGDIVFNPADSLYYTIIGIADPATMTLDQIPSAGGAAPTPNRRRWLLKLFTRSSAGEAPISVTAGTTLRFFFGAWFSIGSAIYDATLEMFEGGEEPPLSSAGVGVAGKVQMYPGLSGAKAGAVQNVQLRGAAVGAGVPVYSLGFDGAFDATGGVANVTMAGEKGEVGDPGTGTGPPGPAGPAGTGFDTFSAEFASVYAFRQSGSFGPTPAPGTVHRLTYDYPSTIKYLHGGIQEWSATASNHDWNQDDHFSITAVYREDVSAGDQRRGVIENTRPNMWPFNPTSWIGLFLNGAG